MTETPDEGIAELVEAVTQTSGTEVHEYLSEKLFPVLSRALKAVERERPDDPVKFVATYLLKYNPE